MANLFKMDIDIFRKKILAKAIKNNDLKKLKQILTNTTDINEKDEYGDTPLHNAISNHLEMVQCADIFGL